jgi:hypothetical protein
VVKERAELAILKSTILSFGIHPKITMRCLAELRIISIFHFSTLQSFLISVAATEQYGEWVVAATQYQNYLCITQIYIILSSLA